MMLTSTDRNLFAGWIMNFFCSCRSQITIVIFGLAAMTGRQVVAADAIDRLTASKLEAVNQARMKFQAERHEIPRPGPLKEFRANLHVHSAFSHDSRGKIDDIVAAAKAAGTSVVMFTEHPADHYDIFLDGHSGIRDGVLLIPGAEYKGMLVYPRLSIKSVENSKAQELSEFVRGRDGLTFISHLEERMDFDAPGITGNEIYNTHADAKDEKRLFSSMKNPLWMIGTADLIRKYPQEAFSSLQDYPADYLKRWDELCQMAPHTGVSANDAHQNIGIVIKLADDNKVQIEDALGEKLTTLEAAVFKAFKSIPDDAKSGDVLFELRMDRYENSLRHVATHILADELSQPAVWQALNQGQAFVAFDWIADSTGFDFHASNGTHRTEMGHAVGLSNPLKLQAQAPLPCHWRLFHNGQIIHEFDGTTLNHDVNQLGVFRVEAWLKVADEDRIWILSNPIYVTSKTTN